MFLTSHRKRRQVLKYFALVFAVFIFIRLLFGGEKPSEQTELPILVVQRGNDRYFTTNIRLNSERFAGQTLQWEQNKADSTTSEVTVGKLNVHIWGEICGVDLINLKNHVLFPKFPSRRFFAKTTKFTHAVGNFNYGERIFGLLLPKLTGIYHFQLHGGSVEVWVGKNADSASLVYKNSVNHDLVGKFELNLIADNKYYLEILHKQADKVDGFELTWKIPGSSEYVYLSGADISVKLQDDYLKSGEVDSTEPNLEVPLIHKKNPFPILGNKEQRRNDLFNLPPISNDVLEGLLPTCSYVPSYIVDHELKNYRGVWETHYNSLYPIDNTNVTRDGWVCLGNDILKENEADKIVALYMKMLDKHSRGQYKLKEVLSVEKNHDVKKGDRYLLELEIIDRKTNSSYRLSEWVYKEKGKATLCTPEAYRWDRNATVNIVLTVGGRQGRWVQHFINNLAEIYRQTKDRFLNVIIMDFHSKDINIEKALKKSGLPRYILLHMKSKFHKTIGLQYAMNIVTDPNDIVFVCDLHLYLPVTIIDHIRKHCIQGKTAFNPLLIRLDCGYTASHPSGRWEHDGFGPIATFKSDWDRFGGMNVERFKHSWGGEDWDMVDRILSAGLEIERLKILNFYHFYHTKKGMWKESEQ